MTPDDSDETAKPRTWLDMHSPDLALAHDQLGLTIDALHATGDRDKQSTAADTLRELSDAIRAMFELDVDPSYEQNEIFYKKLGYAKRWTIHDADLEARQLAYCADAHMRMIRGVRKETIAAIREALAYVELGGLPPDPDRGIFNAKLKGIAAGKGLETPYPLWGVTLGTLADQGERRTLETTATLDDRGKDYVQAIFRKLMKLW